MHRNTLIILTGLLAGSSGAAWAVEQMKPGLWEMSLKSDAFKQMPQISAEQMEQMRKMGVTVPRMQDGAMISKVCITKEMAASGQPPIDAKESGCQTRNYQRSANTYSADIICDGPHMKGTGRVTGSFSGNTSYTSIMDFKGTSQGHSANMRHETSGKWIAADCGNVKPIPLPPTGK